MSYYNLFDMRFYTRIQRSIIKSFIFNFPMYYTMLYEQKHFCESDVFTKVMFAASVDIFGIFIFTFCLIVLLRAKISNYLTYFLCAPTVVLYIFYNNFERFREAIATSEALTPVVNKLAIFVVIAAAGAFFVSIKRRNKDKEDKHDND